MALVSPYLRTVKTSSARQPCRSCIPPIAARVYRAHRGRPMMTPGGTAEGGGAAVAGGRAGVLDLGLDAGAPGGPPPSAVPSRGLKSLSVASSLGFVRVRAAAQVACTYSRELHRTGVNCNPNCNPGRCWSTVWSRLVRVGRGSHAATDERHLVAVRVVAWLLIGSSPARPSALSRLRVMSYCRRTESSVAAADGGK